MMEQPHGQQQLIGEAVDALKELEGDGNTAKNIKVKIQEIISVLQKNGDSFKAVKALDGLEELTNNPNLDQQIRTQLWNVASILEKSNGQ
ncbi:UPF0147 family protein [Candidatus Woesearchaeota archaeon]|nr:UPF0147 family protein [Candidatus Woesearchaeota archaeon]